jgi:hypothetical protein
MNTKNERQAGKKSGFEVARFFVDLGLDVFGDCIPFWAAVLMVAVVGVFAAAFKLLDLD